MVNIQVEEIHHRMVHWMIQTLIRLAPEREELSAEAKRLMYDANNSPENLEAVAFELIGAVQRFSNSMIE